MLIKNYMEDIVWEQLDTVLASQKKVCTCEHCRYDIVALSLNFLPPRYVATHEGAVYSKVKSLEQQFGIDIITAITNAVIIVNKSPHHDKEDLIQVEF